MRRSSKLFVAALLSAVTIGCGPIDEPRFPTVAGKAEGTFTRDSGHGVFLDYAFGWRYPDVPGPVGMSRSLLI